ncbi:MAG: queuosine precursor transporter [Acidimicrobiales bacterium]
MGASSSIPRLAVVAVAAYAGAQVVSDIASLKIGVVAGRAVDMGTFIYPITFTLRDVVHKVLGRRAARTLIVTCAGTNLAMSAYLGWAATFTSDPAWGLGDEFATILGPLWRIVIASIVAEVVSQLVDTEVYHWFVDRVTTRHQWARVLVSNSMSIPIDNAIFAVGAFGAIPFLVDHPLTLPWEAVWDIFLVNLTVKFLVTVASTPLIYVVPDRFPNDDNDDDAARAGTSATASG